MPKSRIPFGFLTLAALALSALGPAAHPAYGETTYGKTHAVPKEEPASDPSGGGSFQGEDHEEDGGEPLFTSSRVNGPGLEGACFSVDIHAKSFGELAGALIVMPFFWGICSAGYGVFISHAHLLFGNEDVETVAYNAWRYGAGFGLEAGWQPETSGGPGIAGHLEAVGPVTRDRSLELRVRAAAQATAMMMHVDYERGMIVDADHYGVQRDVMTGYSQKRIPLTAELLWQPGSKGFYLGAGAGAVLLREDIQYRRGDTFGYSTGDLSESRAGVFPAAVASIGRDGLDSRGRPAWYFEIRYQAMAQRPRHLSSFPSDNTALTQSLGWEWGWYW
ncbi:MAG: hypothetical protein JWP91_922 [Fibrobacteres bacterium]|nr:hypothetical protein [Fibrobacterota bacterium]